MAATTAAAATTTTAAATAAAGENVSNWTPDVELREIQRSSALAHAHAHVDLYSSHECRISITDPMECQLLFNLPDDYPRAAPLVRIRFDKKATTAAAAAGAAAPSAELKKKAEQELNQIASSACSAASNTEGCILDVLERAIDLLTEFQKHQQQQQQQQSSRDKSNNNNNKKKGQHNNKKNTNSDASCESSKAPKMKTADDVIARIRHDPTLSSKIQSIVICYEDRFYGLTEVAFSAFPFMDVDPDDRFSIPRHRIVYFRLDNQLLWDKRTRLDNIFGSTGGDRIAFNEDGLEVAAGDGAAEGAIVGADGAAAAAAAEPAAAAAAAAAAEPAAAQGEMFLEVLPVQVEQAPVAAPLPQRQRQPRRRE